jgi:hypoxanthine phosphoribosyltransferase
MSVTLRKKYSIEQIDREVQRLADEISTDYVGRELLVIVILKGAFVFAADLIRKIRVPMEVDFIEIASYCGTDSTGITTVTKDVTIPVTGKHVLIIEDIVDEGRCLSFLLEALRRKCPASLKVCTMIDNRRRRTVPLEPDYAGIRGVCGFLVGYGLDMDQKYRELPALYEIVPLDGDDR